MFWRPRPPYSSQSGCNLLFEIKKNTFSKIKLNIVLAFRRGKLDLFTDISSPNIWHYYMWGILRTCDWAVITVKNGVRQFFTTKFRKKFNNFVLFYLFLCVFSPPPQPRTSTVVWGIFKHFFHCLFISWYYCCWVVRTIFWKQWLAIKNPYFVYFRPLRIHLNIKLIF